MLLNSLHSHKDSIYRRSLIDDKLVFGCFAFKFWLSVFIENSTKTFILFSSQDHVKRQTRYISKCPAKEIMTKMEAVAKNMNFHVQTRGYKVLLPSTY